MTKQTSRAKLGGKPKCIKGTACGYSCINGKYTCSDKILKRDADALLVATGDRSLAKLRSTAVVSPLRAGEAVRVNYDAPPFTLTTEEIADVESYTKAMLSSADLYINISPESMAKVLESGRFKTQFETGSTGSAVLNTQERAEKELASFNYELDTEPANRPIYGTATTGGYYATGAFQYGAVAIKLKPELRSRTTVTVRDSLSAIEGGSPIDNPKIESIRVNAMVNDSNYDEYKAKDKVARLKYDIAATMDSESDYVEAQFHGGVSVSDIASVALPKDSKYDSLAKDLAKRGITVDR